MRSRGDNLRKFNIRVNIVAPYMTRTPLSDAIPDLFVDLERSGITVQEPIWIARSVGTLAADEKYHGPPTWKFADSRKYYLFRHIRKCERLRLLFLD